jgi:hypothetical protein
VSIGGPRNGPPGSHPGRRREDSGGTRPSLDYGQRLGLVASVVVEVKMQCCSKPFLLVVQVASPTHQVFYLCIDLFVCDRSIYSIDSLYRDLRLCHFAFVHV